MNAIKKITFGLLGSICVLVSCRKENGKVCNFSDVYSGADFKNPTKTLIPLNTQNFWMYDDSARLDNKMVLQNSKFLLYIRDLHNVDGYNSVTFNTFLPQQTIKGDSLFSTIWTPEQNKISCYDLRPFLFKTSDTAYFNEDKTYKIYPANGQVLTKMGLLTYQYIYDAGYKMYLNEDIGFIRLEIYDQKGLLRSMTLNNYDVQ